MAYNPPNAPRPKKGCKLKPSPPLPIITTENNENHRFRGIFNEFSVTVGGEDMKQINSMGFFGKANLSRSCPRFNGHKPEIVRERVLKRRKLWGSHVKSPPEKIIAVPDSDTDDDDYFNHLKPQYHLDQSGIEEVVCLSLEEAFFLAEAIDCLDIFYKGNKLSMKELWDLFRRTEGRFVQNYVVYYYFRAKNWVVKSGIKFGGDFLLYKQGPPFYHASYVVIINVVDENLKRMDDLNWRSMKYFQLMGLDRLCETAGKELLICELIWPSSLTMENISWTDLSSFSINEITTKRWISSQERTIIKTTTSV